MFYSGNGSDKIGKYLLSFAVIKIDGETQKGKTGVEKAASESTVMSPSTKLKYTIGITAAIPLRGPTGCV